MIAALVRWGASALQLARPYLFTASHLVSLLLTLGDLVRGLSYIRWLWKSGRRARPQGRYSGSYQRHAP